MLIALSLSASAATLDVGPSATYATIGAAVSAAAAGDEIVVQPGSYTESVLVTQNLTIRGAAPGVIWTGPGPLLDVRLVSLIAKDLTFSPESGRAVVATSAILDLDGVVVDGGEADPDDGAVDGGGVYLLGGFATLTDCELRDGRAISGSGGLLYASGTTVSVAGGTFTNGRAEKGGAIYVINGALDVSAAAFTGSSVRYDDEPGRGGAIRTQDTTVTIDMSVFDANEAQNGFGGQLALTRGTARIEGSVFSNGVATEYYGGAVALSDVTATLVDTTFENNEATIDTASGLGHGGALLVSGSSGALIMEDCTFRGNRAIGFGGAVRIEVGDAAIADSLFESNEASLGGAMHLATAGAVTLVGDTFSANIGGHGAAIRWRPDDYAGSLVIDRCAFEGNVGEGYGAALYARSGGSLTVTDATFVDQSALVGGALMLWDIPDIKAERNLFCNNRAQTTGPPDGGAVTLYQAGLSGTVNLWRNNLFIENVAEAYGGGLNVIDSGPILVENNTFAGNTALELGGHLALRGTAAIVRNNAFVGATYGFGMSGDLSSSVSATYNAWFDNAGGDLGDALVATDPTDIESEPGFQAWSVDTDCDNDNFALQLGSALRDGGDPSIVDLDGSRSDIGAFGGPAADVTIAGDADVDGWATSYDCDDANPASYPGATEIPYDGVDQDCSGADLVDVDGDGFIASEARGDDCGDDDPAVHPGAPDAPYDAIDQDCGGGSDFDADADAHDRAPEGDDCDDADPAIHAGATDIPDDGVDQDCDGADDAEAKACGCHTSGSGGLFAVMGAVLLVRRRARR